MLCPAVVEDLSRKTEFRRRKLALVDDDFLMTWTQDSSGLRSSVPWADPLDRFGFE